MKCVIKFFLKGLKLCPSGSDSKKNIGQCQHYVMAIWQICKKNCTSKDICRTLLDFSHTNTSFCTWYQNLNTVTFFWCRASIYSCPSKRFVANSISPLRQRPNATASVDPPVGAQRLSFDSPMLQLVVRFGHVFRLYQKVSQLCTLREGSFVSL